MADRHAVDGSLAALEATVQRVPIRVLQVEDDADDADLILLELRRAGFAPEAVCVQTIDELQAVLGRPFDLVISDYRIGPFEAPQALALVRSIDPDVPFLIVSGSIGEESAVAAMRAGAQDFFLKGSLHRLGAAAARELERARAGREQRTALTELRDARARLQALFDQAIVGIAQLDLRGRFIFANQTFCHLVGRSLDELLEKHDVDVVASGDTAAYVACIEQMRRDHDPCALEVRYLRPNGSSVWVNASFSELRAPEGDVIGAVAVVHDVTERRRIEAEREKLVTELGQAVKLGETFAGVLGHDLRNPLATITMAAQMLSPPASPDAVAPNVARIVRSAERMRSMIDQLLDFTRIRIAGGIPVECANCDLAAIAHQAVDEIINSNRECDVRLEVQGTTRGRWDRDRLLQLVSNLVANAVAHGDPSRTIRVKVDGTDAAKVRLSVENGGTIPSHQLPTVFEPLHASESSRKHGGLGLGLFIVRHIARAHGGDALVTSTPAAGTAFEVVLPRPSDYDFKSKSL